MGGCLRFLHDASDLLLIGLQAMDEVLLERAHAIGKDTRAVQQVADHQRLVHVELELAVHATNGGSDVVAHDLSANHGQSLALRRVHLSGHNATTRLVLRQDQLAETASGTASQVSDILGNLGEGSSQGVQAAMSLDDGIVGGQRLELVWRSLEGDASHLANLLSDALGKSLKGVDACSDSGTTLSQQLQIGQGALDTLDTKVKLSNIAREFLGQGERGSILQVRTSNLDNLLGFKIVYLCLKSCSKAVESRQQITLKLEHCGDVHDGGKGVVGGGASVDVVVGVDGSLGAHLAAEDLNGTVRDDLVGVHVGLGARAGLPDDEGEVVKELAIGNFFGGLLDGLSDLGICRQEG